MTVCSAILAIAQDALGLAAAAALGGFAAPILASTGAGSHVALFSYFTLLNAGIFAIAWFNGLAPVECHRLHRHLRHRIRLGPALLLRRSCCGAPSRF